MATGPGDPGPPPTHFTVTLAERQLLQMLVPHIHAPIATPDYELRDWYEQWRCLQQIMAGTADADRVAAIATRPWQQEIPQDTTSLGPNPSFPHRTGFTPRTPATPLPIIRTPTHPEEDIADRIWAAAASSAASHGHQEGDIAVSVVVNTPDQPMNPPALRQGHWVQQQPGYRPMPRRPAVDRRWHPWHSKGGQGGAYGHCRSPLWQMSDEDPEGPGSSPMSSGTRPSFNPRALGSMIHSQVGRWS